MIMNLKSLAKPVTLSTIILTLLILTISPPTQAFDPEIHREITREGLGISPNDSFLRTAVRRNINHQHNWMDDKWSIPSRATEDEKHFDDCEFDGAAKFIRESYKEAQAGLASGKIWDAATMFGRLLHTVQDFYSHSNWVELLSADNPAITPGKFFRSDFLVDLSGAQSSLAQHWFAPAGGEVVRGNILLGSDDWEGLPDGWAIDRNGGGLFIPTVLDAEGRTRGRLLETAQGTGDDECDVSTPRGDNYTGIKHENLNKDNHTAGPEDMPYVERRNKYIKARALATLQTGYEWCRLVREAGLINQDGLLLALWVRPGGNPHPPGTPCQLAAPGTMPIVVTIQSIRVLNVHEDDDDPGEIQLAAVLYDNPFSFHRSVHVTNRHGRMQIKTGDLVLANQLPPPLTLCVSQDQGATFTVHAWDNDDSLDNEYGLDFDNYDDVDDVLVGFQVRFDGELPTGVQIVRSDDLEVHYRVSRTIEGANTPVCPLETTSTN
jgi:hypothetical protein